MLDASGGLWAGWARPPGHVGPVPVLVEERSGAVLIIALAITVHAEAVKRIDQPHRQPGGDEQRPTFEARLA
jgi:hypothetical protein